MKNKKGFTLVELVIVIAVIAILASVLLPTFAGILERAKESVRIQKVTSARDEYFSSNHNIVTLEDMDNYKFLIDGSIYTIEKGVISKVDDINIDTLNNEYTLSSMNVSNNVLIYIPNEPHCAEPLTDEIFKAHIEDIQNNVYGEDSYYIRVDEEGSCISFAAINPDIINHISWSFFENIDWTENGPEVTMAYPLEGKKIYDFGLSALKYNNGASGYYKGGSFYIVTDTTVEKIANSMMLTCFYDADGQMITGMTSSYYKAFDLDGKRYWFADNLASNFTSEYFDASIVKSIVVNEEMM